MKTSIERKPQTRSERRELARLHKGIVRTCKRFDDDIEERAKKAHKIERTTKEERWQLLYQ